MGKKKASKTIWIGEIAPTPLGPVWVALSEMGLWALEYDIPGEQFIRAVLQRGAAEVMYDPQKVFAALEQVDEYLSGERQRFDLPVDWWGMTDFQINVRKATMAIPYGETASYGEVAGNVGRPSAARAVGRVQATNPIPLIIPCHRVVGADGGLHGYGGSGGLKTKAWLLNLEKGE